MPLQLPRFRKKKSVNDFFSPDCLKAERAGGACRSAFRAAESALADGSGGHPRTTAPIRCLAGRPDLAGADRGSAAKRRFR